MNKALVRDATLAYTGEYNNGIHIVQDSDKNVVKTACGDVKNPDRTEDFTDVYTSVTHICRDCNDAVGVYDGE